MVSKNVILEEEMPYQKLEKIGLTKGEVLNFPRPVLEPLMSGGVTPLIMTTIERSDGQKFDVPLKLQLLRDKEGNVTPVVYPIRKEILNDKDFSRKELDDLQHGVVLRKEMRSNGQRIQQYFQLDKETNSVIQKDASNLRLSDRMQEIERIGNIELGLNQKKAILEGKPVELQTGETKVTVGVDLKEPSGFKSLQGDMQDWKEKQMIEYDRLTPGFMGYVKTEANRWEYQQVVKSLEYKETKQTASQSLKQGF